MTGKHFFKKWLTPKGRKKEQPAASGVHIPPSLGDDDDGGFLNRASGGLQTLGQGGAPRRRSQGVRGVPQHRTSWPNRGARNGFVPYEDPCIDFYPPPPASDTCSTFSEDSLMITPAHSMSCVDQFPFNQEQV